MKKENEKKSENVVKAINNHIKQACDDVKLNKINELDKTLLACSSHHSIVDVCVRAKVNEEQMINLLIKHSTHTRYTINSVLQAKQRIARILLSVKLSKTETKYITRSKKRNLFINSIA